MGTEVDLIQKQIKAFENKPYRLIVNANYKGDQFTKIPDNVKIEPFLPQPSIIEQSDLVIHHGGNNTFCECLYYGKPMIILPFAWDGFDNAAIINDLNLVATLDRYKSNTNELVNVVKELLDNSTLKEKLTTISREMQNDPGPCRAAMIMDQLIRKVV